MKEMDWYSFKMCTHKIHRIYRLLDKLISVICPSHVFPKCTFHHLQYGPWPIEINVLILDHTSAAIHKQLNFLYEENFCLEQSSRMNQLAFILHKNNKYCYIFTMVNCTYISKNSSHVIQFHLKTSFSAL